MNINIEINSRKRLVFIFVFTFWQILNEAAVAKICDVDEDIVAN